MAKHLMITGVVQGVGYRAAFERQAAALGLRDWVRNRHDGSVEAEVDGEDGALNAIVSWAHQGPPAARVDSVTVLDTIGKLEAFRVLPTA